MNVEIIDMIFVEFAANDPFGAGVLTDMMDQPKRRIKTKQESLEFVQEILIRRMQRFRNRDDSAPAIMYVECALHYRHWPWGKNDVETNDFHFFEYGRMGSWAHNAVNTIMHYISFFFLLMNKNMNPSFLNILSSTTTTRQA